MMADEFQHFIEAQEPVYDRVVQELTNGEKRSHWMWFIFPQLIGLGHSFMAQRFALHSLNEARRYAEHPVLGKRLRECARILHNLENRTVPEIFGSPDDLKFHSSMTLFALALPQEPLFESVLNKYFAGQRDKKTIEILSRKP